MDDKNKPVEIITNTMSSLIAASLQAMERERTNPMSSADRSDDWIKFNRERAANLRRLRQEFEDEMARVLPFGG